ncbi:hypothetical protein QQF64_023075 [Cirrhinus molitorella]|uniref:Uncharacterized protein n=1 Tax=Cirrhinus molitorella TaxID=172907 RepID=A0ABR3L465_9TELE
METDKPSLQLSHSYSPSFFQTPFQSMSFHGFLSFFLSAFPPVSLSLRLALDQCLRVPVVTTNLSWTQTGSANTPLQLSLSLCRPKQANTSFAQYLSSMTNSIMAEQCVRRE